MKKLLALIILASSFYTAKASHVSGGEIFYKYIGDSTGTPHHYMVYLNLYRRNATGSAALSNTNTVIINSSCYAQQNITVTRYAPGGSLSAGDGGVIPTFPTSCVNQLSPQFVTLSVHNYKAAVILPGKCANFTLYLSLCCRNSSITNLTNSGSTDFVSVATLNNMQGPNSSPQYERSPLLVACVGQNVFSPFAGREIDGDSLFYSLAPPPYLGNNGVVIYDALYSAIEPALSKNGVQINPANGLVHFIPTNVENDMVSVHCEEFRYDSTFNFWYPVSTTNREVMMIVVATCNIDSLNWVTAYSDSLSNRGAVICGDSTIELTTQINFLTSSLASDGSDFALLNSQNILVPIIGAQANPTFPGSIEANSFNLKLSTPISYNDTLLLISRKGNDFNSLINVCGEQLNSGDTSKFAIDGCSTSVSLVESANDFDFQIYPNPTSGKLNVELGEELKTAVIEIYDLKGKILAQFTYSPPKLELSLQNLPPGIYLIKAQSSEWSDITKFEKL